MQLRVLKQRYLSDGPLSRSIDPHPLFFPGVIILVPGKVLVREFKNQLMFKVTGGTYIQGDILTQYVDKMKTSGKTNISTRSVRHAVTIALSTSSAAWYKVMSYASFYNKVVEALGIQNTKTESIGSGPKVRTHKTLNIKVTPDLISKLARIFGNKMIACDEFQTIRPRPGADNENTRIYELLKLIFRLSYAGYYPLKKILSSATPTVDDPNQIKDAINLMSPEDVHFTDAEGNKTDDINKIDIDQFEPYVRGKVSYVRALDIGVKVVFQGNPLNKEYITMRDGKPVKIESELKLVAGTMSIYQSYGYAQALLASISGRKTSGKARTDAWVGARQARDIVYPDKHLYGMQGYYEYFAKRVKGDMVYSKDKKPEVFETSQRLIDYIQLGETDEGMLYQLKRISVIFAKIIKKCIKQDGCSFIFTNLKATGAVSLATCFDAFGFERFNTTENEGVLKRSEVPRYAIITGDTGEEQIAAIMEVWNHPDNYMGAYIKILIGSEITKVGFNIFYCQAIHIESPWWNPSTIYQAMSRGIRSDSHIELLKQFELQKVELRKELDTLLAKTNADADRIKWLQTEIERALEIKVYLHAAVPITLGQISGLIEQTITEQETTGADLSVELDELREYKAFLLEHRQVFRAANQDVDEETEPIDEGEDDEDDGSRLPTTDVKKTKANILPQDQADTYQPALSAQTPVYVDNSNNSIPLDVLVPNVDADIPLSIDIRMYQDAEQKNFGIKRVSRWLKRCAVDAYINIDRNIRPSDELVTGTEVCDYDDWDYQPYRLGDTNTIDRSTYNLYYAGDEMKRIHTTLSQNLDADSRFGAKSPNASQTLVVNSLHQITQSIDKPPNAFGFRLPTTSWTSPYNQILVGIQTNSLNEYLGTNVEFDEIRNFNYTPDHEEEFKDLVLSLPIDAVIKMIESIYLDKYTKRPLSVADKRLMEVYRNLVFAVHRPDAAIASVNEIPKTKRGANKPKKQKTEENWRNIADLVMGMPGYEDAPIVYVHILDIMQHRSPRWGVFKNYIKVGHVGKTEHNIIIKLLDSNRGWRDLTPATKATTRTRGSEEVKGTAGGRRPGPDKTVHRIYQAILTKIINDRLNEYEKPYMFRYFSYGFTPPQPLLYLVGRVNSDPELCGSISNCNAKVCNSLYLYDLVRLLVDLGYKENIRGFNASQRLIDVRHGSRVPKEFYLDLKAKLEKGTPDEQEWASQIIYAITQKPENLSDIKNSCETLYVELSRVNRVFNLEDFQ